MSGDVAELRRAARLLGGILGSLGFGVTVHPLGGEGGPPLVHAERVASGATHSVLIYGPYDVQPASRADGWATDPFDPVVRDGVLRCRGANDAKGQLVCHVAAIRALLETEDDVPLTIRIVLDPQEEIGSPLLAPFVRANPDLFRSDLCLIADGESIHPTRPQVVLGNRGLLHVRAHVRTAPADVHSGTYGGVMPNAAHRMVRFLASLMAADGSIAIRGFHDNVRPPSPAEIAALDALPPGPMPLADHALADPARPASRERWRRLMFHPTLDVSGLAAGHAAPGVKAIIPAEATANVGFRLVADQEPETILRLLRAHASEAGFPDIAIEPVTVFHPLRASTDGAHHRLVTDALGRAFGEPPVVIPINPGSNPNTLWASLGTPPIEMSFCGSGGGAHGVDEHMPLDRIRRGTIACAAILHGIARDGD